MRNEYDTFISMGNVPRESKLRVEVKKSGRERRAHGLETVDRAFVSKLYRHPFHNETLNQPENRELLNPPLHGLAEVLRPERLHQVVVHAGGKAAVAVALHGIGSEGDDRDL